MVMSFYEQDEVNVSKFNEAALKMLRIHELQRTINTVNANLLAFNPELGRYNYELHLSTNYSLMMEVLPKLKENDKIKEQTAVLNFYNLIYDNMIKNPIYRSKKIRDGTTIISKAPDMDAFNELRQRLVHFEALIRKLLEKHGLGTPARDLSGL